MKSKKACIFSMRSPYPPYGGEKIAMNNIISAINELGYDIDLYIITDEKTDVSREIPSYINNYSYIYVSKIKRYLNVLKAFFKGKPLQVGYFNSAITKIKNNTQYNLLLIHTVRLVPIAECINAENKIAYFADAISMNYKKALDKVAPFLYPIYRYESAKLYEYERQSIHLFKRVIFHSTIDSKYLKLTNDKRVKHISIVKKRIQSFIPLTKKTKKRFIVIANYKSIPNRMVVDDFINSHELFFDTNFEIVFIGPNLDSYRKIKINSISNFNYLGIVEDLSSEIIDSFGTICNVKVGAGMQNKIVDGLSNGRVAFASTFSIKPYLNYVNDIKNSGIIEFETMKELIQLLNDAVNNYKEHTIKCKNAFCTAELFDFQTVVNGYQQLIESIHENEKGE